MMALLRTHEEKLTKGLDKLDLKQLLMISTGIASYFVDKQACKQADKVVIDILMAVS